MSNINTLLEDLYYRYELSFYIVGEAYDIDQNGNPIPLEHQDKWFLAVNEGSQFENDIVNIPLEKNLKDIITNALYYLKIDLNECTKNKEKAMHCICPSCKKSNEKEELDAIYETAREGWYD